MGMTVAEANALPITPPNLRAIANRPCDGERSIILRRAADELDALMAEIIRLRKER